MAKTVASKIQAALQQDGAWYVPASSYDNFYQPNEVTGIGGNWTELKQGALANAPVEEPLDERRGVWISEPIEKYELDVRRNFKEFCSTFGIYTGGAPTVLAAGVIEHPLELVSPKTGTRYLFTRVYEDEDGVWFHRSCEANEWTMQGGDKYVNMEMQFLGASVTAAQHIATAVTGPATYNGRVWIRQTSRDDDTAALTYNLLADTAGAIDGATAKVKTKLSSEGAYGLGRFVTNRKPFPIEDSLGNPSGLEAIWTTGAAAAGGNALVVGGTPDLWTTSTRGTAPSPTIPTGNTVFVPTNFEWTVKIGGVTPPKRPKNIMVKLNKGLGNDDHGWGSDETNSHPVRKGFMLTGSLTLETENLDWYKKAVHFQRTSLKLTAEGDYVAGQVVYRQTWEINMPAIQIMKFPRDLKAERTPIVTVPFWGKPTTPSGINLITGRIINDVADWRV
jgi:hypothetical protein